MCLKGILTWLMLINLIFNAQGAPDKLVCYVGSWAVYRQGNGNFPIDQIPANLCTHLIYSFVTAENSDLKLLDPWADLNLGGFQKLVNLKKINPKLKVMVAMGGWNAGSSGYSILFSNANRRQTFAKNAVLFLKRYGFDGLDLDWEYPAQRGGAASDVANFVDLCRLLRVEFSKYGLLLTAAVGISEGIMRQSYDVRNLARYLDFINLMGYDFHAGGSLTGHNAPLYVSKAELNTQDAKLNIKYSVDAWIRNGAPASKLVLGMSVYGHSFNLKSASQSCRSARCPASGDGIPGPITQQSGYLGYNEICSIMRNDPNGRSYWDDEAKVPYYITGNQWISYDNARSFNSKLDFILAYNLGGAMIWSIETDDFRGLCGAGTYPLISIARQRLIH